MVSPEAHVMIWAAQSSEYVIVPVLTEVSVVRWAQDVINPLVPRSWVSLAVVVNVSLSLSYDEKVVVKLDDPVASPE